MQSKLDLFRASIHIVWLLCTWIIEAILFVYDIGSFAATFNFIHFLRFIIMTISIILIVSINSTGE